MTDYTKNPSGSSTMMIRDTGGNVEFWFKAGSSTFNHQQDWGWSIDGGGWNMGIFDLTTGGAWHNLGTIYVGPGANRQVGMRIVGEGLGWPTTDLIVTLPRATVPGTPYWTDVHAVSTSQVFAQFAGNGDGGAGVDTWQIGYGTDPWNPQYFYNSYTGTIGGLTSGQWWYFWGRGHNAVGWSGWSARAQAFTWRVPDAPGPATFSEVSQTAFRATFPAPFDGGEPVDEYEISWSLDPEVHTDFTRGTSLNWLIQNLQPGRQYYVWARARNAVGWGPYSAVRVVTLVAGALVKADFVYKRAVPYVNDEGVWRLAQGFAKSGGLWRPTP